MSDARDPTKNSLRGEWYLVVQCKACDKGTVLAHDKDAKVASGVVKIRVEDDGQINVQCSACGETRAYSRHEIRSVQAE